MSSLTRYMNASSSAPTGTASPCPSIRPSLLKRPFSVFTTASKPPNSTNSPPNSPCLSLRRTPTMKLWPPISSSPITKRIRILPLLTLCGFWPISATSRRGPPCPICRTSSWHPSRPTARPWTPLFGTSGTFSSTISVSRRWSVKSTCCGIHRARCWSGRSTCGCGWP